MEIMIKLVEIHGRVVPIVHIIEQISPEDELTEFRERLAHKQKVIDGLQDVIHQHQDIKRRQEEEINNLRKICQEFNDMVSAIVNGKAAGPHVS